MVQKRKYNSNSNSNAPYKRPRTFTPNQRFVVTRRGGMAPPATRGYRPNNVERKVNDIDTATYQANTTGVFTILCLPVVGADFNQRVGRKITIKSVYIKGMIQNEQAVTPTAGANGPQHLRMVIVYDMQPNGAVPATTDLLVSATPASQLNLNNRDRFKVLADKEFVMGPTVYSTTATQSVASFNQQAYFVKKYKKLNLEVVFSTSGGTIADITSGALYMFWIGSRVSGAGDGNFVGSTRVRYADN